MKPSILPLGTALALAACFSPSGGGDPTDAAVTATTGTTDGPLTDGTTTGTTGTTGTTVDPTTGAAATAVDPTTGGLTTESTTGTTGPDCQPTDCQPGQVCHEGQCVDCVDDTDCDGLACDPVDHVCRPCREHADCPGSACELDDGNCFPAAARHTWVEAAAACGDQDCAMEAPCCTVADALAQHRDSGEHLVVHVGPGEYAAGFSVLAGGQKIAVLGGPDVTFTVGADAVIRLGAEGPDVEVLAELYVSRIAIETGQGSAAVRCNGGADLWLDDARITDYAGRAVAVSDCEAVIRRSELSRNTHAVAVDDSGRLRLENTIVAHLDTGAALELSTNAVVQLVYATLGDITEHPKGLLGCVDDTVQLLVRNSVLVSGQGADTSNCLPSVLDIRDSVVSAAELANVETNTLAVDSMDVPTIFEAWLNGELRLADDGGPLIDRAVWHTVDPLTDIDGDPRPLQDGALDVAGADRLPDP